MKTDLTKQIEKSLTTYAPTNMGGIDINTFRGWSTAFEVPVACGSTSEGIIDAVRVAECFSNISYVGTCMFYGIIPKEGLIDAYEKRCTFINYPEERYPQFCDHGECRWCMNGKTGDEDILITCFEIKITKADFKSKNGHNFVGNLNYYVVPSEIYHYIKDMVPEHIGIIIFTGSGLRRKKDASFRSVNDETQKWLILSVLKRIRRSQ